MDAAESWTPGALVAARFELVALLAEGGQADVWSAREVTLQREVAIKVQRRRDNELRARLLREERVAALVQHPALVAVLDRVELPEGRVALVLERLHGETLAEIFDREGRIPLPRLARWLAPVAGALRCAHDLGIVHRDLTPANVFVLRDGAEPASRVLDFGSTKLTASDGAAAETAALTRPGASMGTPLYMSPEQAFGEEVDGRSDLWSLGVILYRGISGRRPVEGASLRQIYRVLLSGAFAPLEAVAPDAPRAMTAIVERLLQPDPAARPADVREVEQLLVDYARGDVALGAT